MYEPDSVRNFELVNFFNQQDQKTEDLPQHIGCSLCDATCRFGDTNGNMVFKKKCCKKYKRKGHHCKSCPKL